MTRRERLNAAAPDLLTAMKRAIRLADRNLKAFGAAGRSLKCQRSYDECVAAIAKAEVGRRRTERGD